MAQAEAPRPKKAPKKKEPDIQSLIADLMSVVEGLRGEISALREQVAEAGVVQESIEARSIEGEGPTAEVLDLAEEVFSRMTEQIAGASSLDSQDMEAELAMALSESNTEEPSASDDNGATIDLPANAEPDLRLVEEPQGEGELTEAEISALFQATGLLGGEAAPADETAEASPGFPDSSDTNGFEVGEIEPTGDMSDGGMMLSDAEIQALLNPAAAGEPEVAAEVVSAEEIQAMLGLKDPSTEIQEPVSAESPAQAADLAAHIETVETQVEPLDPVQSSEGETVPQSPVEIEPSAVAKVPGELAAKSLAIPFAVVDGVLHCLAVEPMEEDDRKAFEEAAGMPLNVVYGDMAKVVDEIRARYGEQDDVLLCKSRDYVPTLFDKIPFLKRGQK